VGNVVGVYHGSDPAAPRLLTGSHYDTVRNGGKYDGRLGILVPMACVRELHRAGRRLPFGIEVVGFAEEEGQRYKATFLGSGALTGDFDPPGWTRPTPTARCARPCAPPACRPRWKAIGAEARPGPLPGLRRGAHRAGPGAQRDWTCRWAWSPRINGSVRYLGEVIGMASHAGTTPMDRRRDAAAAVAELALAVEKRAAAVPGTLVGTVGMLQVPSGSINVVPGRCQLQPGPARHHQPGARRAGRRRARRTAAHLRAPRRGFTLEETLAPPPRPAHPAWQAALGGRRAALGLPVHRMPSGAGHDAMKLHEVMPQAMLFVRGGNAGISHNPLESITNDDAELCVRRLPAPAHNCHENSHDPTPTHAMALDAWIDAHFDEEVRFLQALVRVPTDTPPGNNAPHAERTAELLAAMGYGREAPGARGRGAGATACSPSPT
jgi:N-carbamoyl-L-amino-acid hydrolase